jgi:hypothetical protein
MKINRSLYLLYLSIVLTARLSGQNATGEITGLITDPTNAAVPGANIAVTEVQTGSKRDTVTGVVKACSTTRATSRCCAAADSRARFCCMDCTSPKCPFASGSYARSSPDNPSNTSSEKSSGARAKLSANSADLRASALKHCVAPSSELA